MAGNRTSKGGIPRLSRSKLIDLVNEAIVDAYDDEEQQVGFFTMMEDYLEMPFETTVLGIPVMVKSVVLDDENILAVCVRGKDRQAIPILNLPLPSPPPKGVEWIKAYRLWMRGGTKR